MSLLRDFEQRLEALFEGFFTRQFKSGVQPVEIAKKLAREMDANRTISVAKLYVPNSYTIMISKADAERLSQFEAHLVAEFQDFLISHAEREGYDLVGRPSITFAASPDLSLGEIIVQSSLEDRAEEAAPAPQPKPTRIGPPKPAPQRPSIAANAYLVRAEADGEIKIALGESVVSIGRSADNHVVVADPNVSRHHARIERADGGYVLCDLGSTNGTFVNGAKEDERVLQPGDAITIGTTKLTFRSDARV